MKLQTKTTLILLPSTLLAILILGFWSNYTINQTMEETYHSIMVRELKTFLLHTIRTPYEQLKKDGRTEKELSVKNLKQIIFKQAQNFHLMDTGSLLIFNRNGSLLTGTKGSTVDPRIFAAAVKDILLQKANYRISHIDTDRDHQFYTGVSFDPWEWVLIYSISHDSVHKARNQIIKSAIIIAVIFAGLICAFIWLLFHSYYVQPVIRLKKAASDLAGLKEIGPIPVQSRDELGLLARSMESIAVSISEYREKQEHWQSFLESEIDRNTQELFDANTALKKEIKNRRLAQDLTRKSEDRFKAIFESTTDCILVWDRQYNYVYANQSAVKHIGTGRENIIGKNIRDSLGHLPDFMNPWIERIDRAFETGETFQVTDEIPVGDRIIFSESVVSPIHDANGDIFAVGVVYRDITKRRKMEQQISDTLELNRKIIVSSSFGIAAYQADGQCVLANDAAGQIAGASKTDLLRQNFNTLDSWKHSGLADAATQVLRDGIPKSMEVRTTSTFKKETWMDIRLTRFNLSGTPHLLLLIDDIFERKMLEEKIRHSLKEKEILLKEIHHRVKNNLQVISGILNMQSSHIKDKHLSTIFQESQDQILSMALVHEQLYNSKNLSSINFSKYLKELVQSLQISYGVDPKKIRVAIDCSDRFLGVDTAIPCGLIINELITNSFKYAFGNHNEGRIFIGFRIDDQKNVQMILKDSGIGFPQNFDLSKVTSLGLRLVYNLVSHQLEGSIRITEPPGAGFHISFPYMDKETPQDQNGPPETDKPG